MDSAGLVDPTGPGKRCGLGRSCVFSEPVRGICPEGWHLPSYSEWNDLYVYAGGINTASLMLVAKTDLWPYSGRDPFGFALLPTGSVNGELRFYEEGEVTNFWTTDESDLVYAWIQTFGISYGEAVFRRGVSKEQGFSIRSLKN